MAFFSGNRDSIPEPELAFSETQTTPQQRRPGRPRKTPVETPESLAPYYLLPRGNDIQHVEDDSLERQRNALVEERVRFEDDGWQHKKKDSEAEAWCEPVTRGTQLAAI